MNDNFSRGSEWRKWDLHVHTPETRMGDNFITDSSGENKWEVYCKILEQSDVQVFGITDYYSTDNYYKFLEEYKKYYPTTNKKFFLNIEFRLKVSVNKQAEEVNFHIIFSDKASKGNIEEFLHKLNTNITKDGKKISCKALKKDDIKGACIDETFVKQLLKEVFGNDICYIIITASNNQGIRPDTKSPRKMGVSDEIDKISDGFWGNENNIEYFLSENRYETDEKSKPKPVFSGCDAHSFVELKESLGKRVIRTKDGKVIVDKNINWIKADPTFEGLKQVFNEPKGRVFIGQEPPILDKIKKNKTKFIKEISIYPEKEYTGNMGKWFDNIKIPINCELSVIIGNKGSGKSAVVDIIGLCGNCKNHKDFSFLNKDKFRDGRHAKNFKATLVWENDENIDKNLCDSVIDGQVEQVKYLPQGYFEKLCNEINKSDEFNREIENVVFRHLDPEDRGSYSDFNELINGKKRIIEGEINLLIEKLHKENIGIINLERKLSPSYLKEIDNKIKQKMAEISALKAPDIVPNPNDDPKTAIRNKTILDLISTLNADIEGMRKNIAEKEEEKTELIQDIEQISNIKDNIKLKEKELIAFSIDVNSELKNYDLNLNEIINLKIDYSQIDLLISDKERKLREIRDELGKSSDIDVEIPITLYQKKYFTRNKLSENQSKLDTQQQDYQKYLKEIQDYEELKNLLKGNTESPGSLMQLQEEKRFIENDADSQLSILLDNRKEIVKKVFEQKIQMISIYKSVKEKIDIIIEENKSLIEDYKVNIDASIVLNKKFSSKYFSFINQKAAGTYYTKEGGFVELEKIVNKVNFDDEQETLSFLDSIINSLKIDQRNSYARNTMDQIPDIISFYDYLFSLVYLEYNYQLKLGKKNLGQLSPGEKGALLLIFYLLLDRNDVPLVIDQPEDNLDNHSVATVLVPFIRKAKFNRQIIMVTHNPNLAVVADAEQVIYVEIEKSNDNKFIFNSGSIENKLINKRIVDVLEGAMPAFNKRKDKYYD